MLSADCGDHFFVVLGLKSNELGVFVVIVIGSDKDLNKERNENKEAIDPASFWLNNHGRDDAEYGKGSDYE